LASTTFESTYAFNNSPVDANIHFSVLERYLDPLTRGRLAPPVVRVGARCWEVGAGGGSVARALAAAAGPSGHVVATDLDPSQLTAEGTLSVRQHDLRTGPIDGGPFDLVHARLVLMHIPDRAEILRDLVRVLAPGGWLVVEEFDCTTVPPVLTAPEDASRELFAEVVSGILTTLRAKGADLGWAPRVHGQMAAAGLQTIDTIVHSESWAGGSSGMALYEINARALVADIVAAGVPDDHVAEFCRLTRDPRFAALSYEFVSTRGRKPPE